MSAPQRIALCLEYPLQFRGGVSAVVEELARGLLPYFSVVIVSPDSDLGSHPLSGLVEHVRWMGELGLSGASEELAKELKRRGVALAHLHFGGTYGWGIRVPTRGPVRPLARAGISVCTTVHSAQPLLEGFCGPNKPLWFKLSLLPFAWLGKIAALQSARTEIAVSRHDQLRLQKYFWPLTHKIRQIYHSRLHEAQILPPSERKQTILCVGHVARRKGQHVLAAAFGQIADRHRDWTLEFAGPTNEEHDAAPLLEAIERGGIQQRVRMHGACDNPLSMMREAGIYVQPSLEEALGLALQEAMFCECPVIGTSVGGIPELIANTQTGRIVPADSSEALAAALECFITDPSLRASLGERARQSIISRRLFSEEMVLAHVNLYHQVLCEK